MDNPLDKTFGRPVSKLARFAADSRARFLDKFCLLAYAPPVYVGVMGTAGLRIVSREKALNKQTFIACKRHGKHCGELAQTTKSEFYCKRSLRQYEQGHVRKSKTIVIFSVFLRKSVFRGSNLLF